MDDGKFKQLIIQSSKSDVKMKLLASVTDLKQEVTEVQQEASQEIASRLNKSAYQFHWKGKKFNTNSKWWWRTPRVQWKKQLAKISLPTDEQQDVMKKVIDYLDEGIKAIAKRQKHIKMANHSDYSWTNTIIYGYYLMQCVYTVHIKSWILSPSLHILWNLVISILPLYLCNKSVYHNTLHNVESTDVLIILKWLAKTSASLICLDNFSQQMSAGII